MQHITIIAEAGVNHNGDLNKALLLVEAAAAAGADYVKFQTFRAENLVSAKAKKAEYQITNTGNTDSQFAMLKKLELTIEDHHALIAHCKKCNIQFLSTAFDLESIDMLENLGVTLFKIPSGEITNLPYLKKIGALKKQVIISTGMCVMSEIADAMQVIEQAGTLKENITVLHCTTDYPTAMADVNLNAMLTIHKELNVTVGYSDHTLGIEVPIAAVAMGAVIIEKHFTLDRTLPGPDHKASLEPDELIALVKSIRHIEQAFGDGKKQPTATEKQNMLVARKSIHVSKDMKQNVVISENDLTMKRPGDGISPMQMETLVGKRMKKDLKKDDKVKWEDVE